MTRGAVLVVAGQLLSSTLSAAPAGAPAPSAREAAHRANNWGVASLEQFRAPQAVEAFRQALAKDQTLTIARVNLAIALLNVPDLAGAEREARAVLGKAPRHPQANYTLGLALRGQNQFPEAKDAFRAVLEADAGDVGANVNLGQILLQERAYPEATAAFRTALVTEPFSATAAYNLALALNRSGQTEEGARVLERFRALKDGGYGTLIGQSYPEQGRYAEALTATGAEPDLVDETTPRARFVEATTTMLTGAAPGGPPPVKGALPGRIALFDLDGDGDLDLLDASGAALRLFLNTDGVLTDATARLGLDPAGPAVGGLAGDLDGDGMPDLLVLRAQGVSLHRATAGRFADVTASAALSQAGPAQAAALADLDHDGDLDIVLGGTGGPDRVWQNTGVAVFKEIAAASGLGAPARVSAIVATDYDNGRDMDLLELVEGGPPRLFRNLRDAGFSDRAAEAGLSQVLGARALGVGDVDKDGFVDALFGADGGDVLALRDPRGRFVVQPAPGGTRASTAALLLDYDGDGLLDALTASPFGLRLQRNLGARWTDVSETALGAARAVPASSLAVGDLDGDGDQDLVLSTAGGLQVLRNELGTGSSVRVRLTGRVSNKTGVGAKVEMRSGSLRQKLETYAATPAPAPADVVFGLGARRRADAVRVIWPSGTLQTEVEEDPPAVEGRRAALLAVEELDRKPSSCPYLYAWDGERFTFVTDFLGGGEMGYFMGPGVYNQPDPVEYVRLTDSQLRPREGRLDLRLTNELEEALFVDRLALLAVAHPAGVEVHPNEGMTAPPKEHRLQTVANVRSVRAAHDGHGHDVLDRVRALDRRAPDDFTRHRIRGYAEPHSLVLDLGPEARDPLLLLTGYTDYAFSSDNVAAHQAGLAMAPPALDVEDAPGVWREVVAQVGIPVGRPQTVVVDLTGLFRSAARRVRLRTNMQVMWDRVQVGDRAPDAASLTWLTADVAHLGERGFSAEVSPDDRAPFSYDYARVSSESPWKVFPGRYTRTGDVKELIGTTDDAFVISRPGDEIALSFDARALPPLPAGWVRTYLLLADGFSKEMDINSATPDGVFPLPFHAMSRYPYAPPEAYPMTPARQRLLDDYNTRVVKASVPQLAAEADRR